jgi:hypothetical protein
VHKLHPIAHWRVVFHRSNLPNEPNENDEFAGANLARAALFGANSGPAEATTAQCGGYKDKIAGTGFNEVRRLADEKSGERRRKSSE